jgi:dTMP kinase
MYILIEGIDTAGKSTQLEILQKKHPEAIFTKEPGGTQLGLKLRQMVLNGEAKSKVAEMFLFLADRAEHSFEVIKKHQDNIIISDRGFISGMAYSNAPLEIAFSLNIMALNGVFPDKIILLELSKDELEHRLNQKENDSIESRGIEYLLDIQNRMKESLKMVQEVSQAKLDILIIDATKPIQDISNKIEKFLES